MTVTQHEHGLFDGRMDGVNAMQQQRERKTTLRSHEVKDLPPLEVYVDRIRNTCERMHVSRTVLARRLRVSTRSLENWQQRRARPNAQAAAQTRMVRKLPDTDLLSSSSARWVSGDSPPSPDTGLRTTPPPEVAR